MRTIQFSAMALALLFATVAQAAPGTCKEATDCKGALPAVCKVCKDGSEGCAHWACQGGKCEPEYCGAATGGTPGGEACKVLEDCKGPLPMVCLACTNKKSGCAHWACLKGKCEPEYCGKSQGSAVAVKGACKVADDCKGALPEICQECTGGKQGCAHHVCMAGKCDIRVCPPLVVVIPAPAAPAAATHPPVPPADAVKAGAPPSTAPTVAPEDAKKAAAGNPTHPSSPPADALKATPPVTSKAPKSGPPVPDLSPKK